MKGFQSCIADVLIFGALLALVVGASAMTKEVFAQIEEPGMEQESVDEKEVVSGQCPAISDAENAKLSDTPEVASDILSPEEDMGAGLAALVVNQPWPPLETEPWYAWLMAHEHEHGLAKAVQDAQIVTGVDGAAILATLWHESVPKLFHHDAGQVISGDGGLAIGIGQAHRDPWEQFFSDETGYKLSLDDLADNVMICALVIKRGGWTRHDAQAKREAYTYYNTGKRGILTDYGKRVHATQLEIEWWPSVDSEEGKDGRQDACPTQKCSTGKGEK